MRRLLITLPLCLVGLLAASPQAIAGPTTPPSPPAVTHVALGVNLANGLVVDPNTGNVYIPVAGSNEVLVRDPSGNSVATVSVTSPVSVAVDPGSGQVWVAGANTITSFDPSTFALGASYSIAPATAGCPTHVDPIGGYVWFTYTCGSGTNGIAVLNPADSSVVSTPLGQSLLLAQPPASTTLYGVDSGADVYKLDLSSPSTGATVVATRTRVCAAPRSIVWSAANDEVVLACQSSGAGVRLTSSLTTVSTYAVPGYPEGAAASSAGYVAFDTDYPPSRPDLYVYDEGATSPLEVVTTFDDGSPGIEDDRVATNADGSLLYVLHGSSLTGEELAIVSDPATPIGRISFASPVNHAGNVSAGGKLTLSDGASAAGVTLSVTRTNPDESQTVLPNVMTAADGSFTVHDNTTTIGSTTYTVGFAGDATHAAASNSEVVDVERAPPTLTLALSHTVITAGGATTLTATISGHGSNSTVSLYANGVQIAAKPVDSARQAVWTVKPHVDTTYQVRYAGDEMYTSRASTNHTVTVKYAVHESMVGSYGMKSGYHLYHYHASCGTASHTGCPKMDAVIVPRPTVEITLQFEEYVGGKWHLLLDRGLKTAANGSCSLLIYYDSTKVENIPMRMSVSYVPGSKTNASNRGAWMNFKVTR